MKRKIAVILAADAGQYTELLAADGAQTLFQLKAIHQDFTALIKSHDGNIFNTAGASLLAEFSSSVEALRCAIAMQAKAEALASTSPTRHRLRFKIGMTIGDVVANEGDLLGDGVNIAARLQGLAGDGGICVSRAVVEQVGNRVEASFSGLGPQSLKNMPEKVSAFLVVPGSTGGPTRIKEHRNLVGTGALIVAILGLVALGVGVALRTNAQPPQADANQAKAAATGAQAQANAQQDQSGNVPVRGSAVCRDIMERAQLGTLSAEDRRTLQRYCQ